MRQLNINFVDILAGEFTMGSPVAEPLRFENETPHRVRMTYPFRMSVTDITVAQFAAFVQDTGYKTAAETEGWAYGAPGTQRQTSNPGQPLRAHRRGGNPRLYADAGSSW